MRKLLLLCLLLPGLPAAAQTLDPTFTSPTSLYAPGAVYALGPPQADGSRLVAGSSTRVNGTATGQLVRLDASGALDQAFQQNVGQASNINAIKAGLNGQYLLGAQGGDITAGNAVRTEVMVLNADGTCDTSFNPGTGPSVGGGNYGVGLDYVVQPDGKVLVGGYFDSFNGTPAADVVRLNADGSVDTGFSVGTGPGTYKDVEALVVQASGKILVGGDFSTFNGQNAPGLARLNADGSLDATLPAVLQAGSEVRGLLQQPDGKVLVTGYFVVNGAFLPLVRLLATGDLDPDFTPATSYISYLVWNHGQPPLALQPDGKIVAIGAFTTPGSPHLARFNSDGTLDNTFYTSSSATNYIHIVGVQPNGRILAGTYNTSNTFGNAQEATLGQFYSNGAYDATFAPTLQAASSVAVITPLSNGTFLAGGSFTEWNGQPVHRLVHLSATGALDDAFSSQTGTLPGAVTSLVVQPDGKIVAGTTSGLLRLAATGSPDGSFVAAINNVYITQLALQPDGKLLVAGSFVTTSNGSTTLHDLVRLTTTGTLDPSFVRATSSFGTEVFIDALLLQPDGRVVIGGLYNFPGVSSTPYVVRYESTGAQDATFTPQAFTSASAFDNRVYALAQQADGKLLVGGHFTQVGTTARPSFARLTTTGALDADFVPSSQFTGTVYSLAVQPNDRVLVGGLFTPTGSSAGANLTRVLTNGQPDASFATTATPSDAVRSLVIQPDGAIVLAGRFLYVNNQPQLGLARITAPNVLAVTAPAATATRTGAWPVPAHEQLHVAPDPSARPQLAELLDALGRVVQRQPLTSAAEFTLPVSALPAGLYLLRLTYATGAVTRQVAIE